MSGAAVEALAVVAADDGTFVAFTHGEVDRTGSPRHQRDKREMRRLSPLAAGQSYRTTPSSPSRLAVARRPIRRSVLTTR